MSGIFLLCCSCPQISLHAPASQACALRVLPNPSYLPGCAVDARSVWVDEATDKETQELADLQQHIQWPRDTSFNLFRLFCHCKRMLALLYTTWPCRDVSGLWFRAVFIQLPLTLALHTKHVPIRTHTCAYMAPTARWVLVTSPRRCSRAVFGAKRLEVAVNGSCQPPKGVRASLSSCCTGRTF